MNQNNFDFLRVFFALNIFGAHIINLIPEISEDYSKFLPFSSYSINGFFVISGFLITKSYYKTPSLKKFFIKRIKRIVPAYTVVIMLSFLGLSLVSSLSFLDYFTHSQTYQYLFANLIFQNYLEPCLPGVFGNNVMCAVNGALWTIKVEEGFYLSLPVIMYFALRFKEKKIRFFILIYVLALIYYNVFRQLDMYVLAKQLPGSMVYFISGVIFYHLYDRLLKYQHILLVIAFLMVYLEKQFLGFYIFFPMAVSFIVFYAAYAFPVLKNFGKYGDFTYGIYIFHFPMIQLVVTLGLCSIYPLELVISGLIVVVIFLGISSWYLLERRFLKRSHLTKV